MSGPVQFTYNISSTNQFIEQFATQLPQSFTTKNTLLDMTANVGAETVYFAENTKLQIDACEIDPEVYKSLSINTKKYKQVKTHNTDSMTMLNTFYDVILCDPPWGGDDYKQGISDEIFREYKQKVIKDSSLKCPLKTVKLGLSSKYPAMIDKETSDEADITSIITKCKCNFLCLKLPLNEINSPYSNDYQRPPGLVNNIPIIQPENKKKKWPAELKYVVVIINKTQFLIEKQFINRMPTCNLYMDNQIKSLDKQHLQILQDYIFTRSRKLMDRQLGGPQGKAKVVNGQKQFSNDQLIKQLNYSSSDKEIFELIRQHVKPVKTELQYNSMSVDEDVARAKVRAEMVKQLIGNVVKPDNTYCDIGSENGIIAKMIAVELGSSELHMYEPFGTENKQVVLKDVDTYFHKYDFQYNTCKFDVVSILTTLHHIMNSEQVVKMVLKSIKPGGVLVIREHRPVDDQDKMILDIQDKLWGYGFTQEYEYSVQQNEKDWQNVQQLDASQLHYYPSSYFTKEQLVGIVGRQPDAEMKGEGNTEKQFAQNGWPWYLYWVVK